MKKLITATALAVALSTSGCSVGVQLATSTLNGYVRAQRQVNTVNMVQQPDGAYEVMQDVVYGKGILINGEYSPTPGITGTNLNIYV